MYLHATEKTKKDEESGRVSVLVENRDFAFSAAEQEDGTVRVYIEWGDDMDGDITRHKDWADAKRWLDTLIKSSGR